MNAKDIHNIQEAYWAVYEPQYINEEVEIATEYFYEMGINEHGIDILIEELGVEEFVEWVGDIAEEYTLNEATRLQKKAAEKNRILIGPKGSKPQSTTKAREKAQGGVTMRSSEAPRSTVRARKKATETAAENQPETKSTPTQTKQGIGGRIGSAFGGFVKRGRQDLELAKKTAQTVGKAVETGITALNKASDSRLARHARHATKKGLRRQQKAIDTLAPIVGGFAGRTAAKVPAIRDTYKAGQRLGRALRLTGEEYDYILSHLLDEGYANDLHGAEVMAQNISEDWIHLILSEAPWQIYGPDPHGSSDSEPRPIGKPYKNKKRAKTKADKLDDDIGGFRHSVHYVDDQP
jgi:hypothetical protein